MSVEKETVRRIARLARLAIDEPHIEPLAKELNTILAWVEQLAEVEVEHVAPLTSVVEQHLKMREDVVTDGGYAEDLMKNAPSGEDHLFVVPKVVE